MTAVYLSIQQVALRTNTHPRTVRRWVTSGLRVAQPIPRGKLLVLESDLLAFLTSNQRRTDALDELVEQTFQEVSSGKHQHTHPTARPAAEGANKAVCEREKERRRGATNSKAAGKE